MTRLAIALSSALMLTIWTGPVAAAEDGQGRARRRDAGTSQGGGRARTQRAPQRQAPQARRPPQRAPQRTAPRTQEPSRQRPRRTPSTNSEPRDGGRANRTVGRRRAPRSDGDDSKRGGQRVAPVSPANGDRVGPAGTTQRGGRRRAPERNPRNVGDGGASVGRARTRVLSPTGGARVTAPGGSTTVIDQRRRLGRGNRGGRVGNVVGGGVMDRRSPTGNVVGTAVARPPLSSRPVVINNYGGGRGYGRGWSPYYGRYRGGPQIYGSYFYFPGYSTFNRGFGVGYGSYNRYNPYWNGYYGHAYGYDPYLYTGYGRTSDYYTGSLRLKVKPRFGEVFVDGYYVGLGNDYDGIFQRLRLEEGPHHIEVVEPGYVPLEFDVMILPGETITYEGSLTQLP